MSPLFLKEKDKKEITEQVQISTSSFLNKTNMTLKQETLRSVIKRPTDSTTSKYYE